MEFGVALIVSGVVFILGTLCASIWGEPTSYVGLYVAGGTLIATGFTARYVFSSATTIPRSIGSFTMSRPWLLFLVAMLMFLALILASNAVGTPHGKGHVEALPSIALGWRLLFHVERASAILGAVGIVLLIGWRGAHGDWPIKFGNVEYAPKEAVRVTADALDKQDKRLRLLEERLGVVDESDGTE